MRGLRLLLGLLAVVAVAAGAQTLLFGSNVLPGGGEPSASVESELRFYGTWWLGAGVFLAWIVRDLEDRGRELRAVSAVLFLAGLSRLLAWADAGRPHTLFLVLLALELLLPPTFVVWHARASRPSTTLRKGTGTS